MSDNFKNAGNEALARAEARIAELERQVGERESEMDAVFARAERAEAQCKTMAADFGEIIIICREQLALPPGNRAMEFSLTVIRDIAKGRAALNPSPAERDE